MHDTSDPILAELRSVLPADAKYTEHQVSPKPTSDARAFRTTIDGIAIEIFWLGQRDGWHIFQPDTHWTTSTPNLIGAYRAFLQKEQWLSKVLDLSK